MLVVGLFAPLLAFALWLIWGPYFNPASFFLTVAAIPVCGLAAGFLGVWLTERMK